MGQALKCTSDVVDDSEDELALAESAPRSNDTGTGPEEDDVESEEEGEPFTFDVALPVRHSYLGNNLQEARGHTLMDLEAGDEPVQDNSPHTPGTSSSRNRARGQICQIPLLPTYSGVSMALVPGQTLPMTLFHPQAISMLRLALNRGRTFGIVAIRNDSEDEDEERNTFFLPTRRTRARNVARQFADDDYPLWDVGTTAEIYEFQEEDGGSLMPQDEERSFLGFTLKAKGSQRFRLLDIHRQVDGIRLAKVQILPEIILPHPLHECRLACLDHLRSESPPPVKPEVGGLVYREPIPSSSQNLEATICSLIKERRKGDDTMAWERICEVKRSLEVGKVQKRLDSAQEPEAGKNEDQQGEGRDKTTKESIMESDTSISLKEKEGEGVKKDSEAGIENSFVNTSKGDANNKSEIVISERSRTKREHDKGAGLTKGKDDGGSPPKSKPSVFLLENKKPPYSRWCRKRDAAVTVWPDWLYNLYDSSVLVSRMHQEFKSLHISKKREKSVFSKWPLWFKSSEKGLDRSFPWLPNDPVELSFWVAQNLPLDDKQRVKLLRMNSAIQRLRWELGALEKRHTFCMSVAGPQGTYVNPGGYVHEALTLSKARGLKVVTHPPSTEHSWFPGYAWSIVECSRCAQHMGWLFTVASSANQQLKPLRFWGLCRKSLVTGQTRMTEEDTV
ncbi:hypothetical protein J437_LFUL004604 [Ladona fulva]|uniref:Protein cereblon n=1 Tax=Ladona fulva TaxID=123851 RepID=A0A8K0K0F9_LADFU|nr:hypothetical protein J437_LFUL004604 [Ladona fulva]